jgi:hypothetical protein
MKIVKVTYTVRPEYVAKNKENVNKFINNVKALNNPGIRYISYLGEDGKTFTHIAIYDGEGSQQAFLALESFLSFQQQRDASGLEAPQHVEMMEVVAASYDIL